MATQVYNSGSGTWTVPTGYQCTRIEGWGAGASGGPGDMGPDEAGGGGGGGGYFLKDFSTPIAAGTGIAYSVGAGGNARTAGSATDGQNGGATTCSTYSLTANGGAGGKDPSNGGTGGAGGTASGGDTNTTGSSGSAANEDTGGNGGNAAGGGGTGGAGGPGHSSDGTAGNAPGGGGGGGGRDAYSGAGAAGRIVFTYELVGDVWTDIFPRINAALAEDESMRDILKGSTDQSVELKIANTASAGWLTGKAYNSAGIDLWYRRQGAAKVSITEATLSALTDSHSDGGFLEIANGVYRLDVPDAAFASGANQVIIGGAIDGGMIIPVTIHLVDYNPQDAAGLGLSRLDAAVSTAVPSVAHMGTAQAGATATITLAAGASSTDDIYNYQRIDILSGTGAGQSAVITDYVGSTKVATVDHAWQVQPDNTSVYRVAYSRVPRDVSKVTGDVEGKVLGGGAGTITGAGVWAFDDGGDPITGGGGGSTTFPGAVHFNLGMLQYNTTGHLIPVFIHDKSDPDFEGLAGVAYNAAGFTCHLFREDQGNAGLTSISLATGTRGSFTSGAWIEKDSTNCPGLYEFHLPNSAISGATSRRFALVFKGATNMPVTIVHFTIAYFPMFSATPACDLRAIQGTALTESAGGRLKAAFTTFFDVASPVLSTSSVNQTGDAYAQGTTILAKIKKWLQLFARRDSAIATDNATELAEINASGGSGGGGYNNQTDSIEALRDRGDAAWVTGTTPDNSGIADAVAAASAAAAVAVKVNTMLVPDGDNYKYTPESHADVPTGLSTEDAEKLEGIRSGVLDPMPELTEDPGATPTLREAQMRQYMEARNKREVTSTTDTIHNDAGAAISSQTLNDDGTKLVRGKAT